jgi:septal ring factor EnvC (AmiA/AmiB activator)
MATWSVVLSDLAPKVENRVSLGNIITILTGCVALIAAGATIQADIRALAQRVEKGELRDEKTTDVLDKIKESMTRIETEQKAVRTEAERVSRQLDRLEQLIRSNSQPAPPPPRYP